MYPLFNILIKYISNNNYIIFSQNNYLFSTSKCLFDKKCLKRPHAYMVGKNQGVKNMKNKGILNRSDRVHACEKFIRLFLEPSKSWGKTSSYGFKHDVENLMGFYICNDDFIDACLRLGIEQKDIPGSRVRGYKGHRDFVPNSVDLIPRYGSNRLFKLKWKPKWKKLFEQVIKD
jgi:hypothetical protein